MGTTLDQIFFAANLINPIRRRSLRKFIGTGRKLNGILNTTIPDDGRLNVLDIGRQEIFEELTPKFLNNKFLQVGIRLSKSKIVELSVTKDVYQIFKLLGIEYDSIDVYNYPHTIIFDLNFDIVKEEFKNKYKLVRNLGTTEHLLNQYNAFKTIHDVTAINGLMHHNLPMSCFWGHGFFKYDPKFFLQLAYANNYKIYSHEFYRGSGHIDQGIYDLLTAKSFTPESLEIAVEYIFQKTQDKPFIIPLDLDLQGLATELSINYQHETDI